VIVVLLTRPDETPLVTVVVVVVVIFFGFSDDCTGHGGREPRVAAQEWRIPMSVFLSCRTRDQNIVFVKDEIKLRA
jgi:hypothetical protein